MSIFKNLLTLTIITLFPLITFAASGPVVTPQFSQLLKAYNEEWVGVDSTTVTRVDMVIDSEKVYDFFNTLLNAGISVDYEGYSDVFLSMPWTSVGETFVEYSRIIFAVDNDSKLINWSDANKEKLKNLGVLKFSTSKANKLLVTHQVAKGKVEDNPNLEKWFNIRKHGKWPVTPNYQINYANAARSLVTGNTSGMLLEVNYPLNTDDLKKEIERISQIFPSIRLISSNLATESFRIVTSVVGGTALEKTHKYPTARLVFDISSLEKQHHDLLFKVIEYYHSYKVPVARIFQEK